MKDITLAPNIKSFADVQQIFTDHINSSLEKWAVGDTVHDSLLDFRDFVEDWEGFYDIYVYYNHIEDSSNMSTFIAWLQEYGIIDFTVDWYRSFHRSVTAGTERIRFYRAVIKELDKEIIRRRYNFDDDDMGILEI
jgi:hypothetical protein